MKKIIVLVVITIVVGILGYFSWKVVKSSGSTVESSLIEFAIEDVENIDRIVISDQYGRVMDVRKEKGAKEWTENGGKCINQEGVEFILDACKKIEFKGYLTENAVDTQKKIMLTQHIKVEYYKNGKWHKTWFIGPASKDHLGQIMLLETDKLGKSDKPVIMTIKGMYGIIEPRFYADPLKWQCTKVFGLQAADIKRVEVVYPLEPARTFSVDNYGKGKFSVKQQNIPLAAIDTQNVMLYLNKFKNVHFDIPNYILTDNQIDSVKRSAPFCIMNINLVNGKKERVRMFRIEEGGSRLNEFGKPVTYEVDRFWAELTNGELVKCQYFVFDPLTLGHFYFPLDLSTVDMNGYQVKDPSAYQK